MSNIFVLMAMLFLHIIDDFVLQSFWLVNGKQKSWWEKNAPDKLYQHDYIAGLSMHAFSWSFMVMLPLAVLNGFNVGVLFAVAMFANAAIHAVIDHVKANRKSINLIVDQTLHIVQILTTWILFVLV